MVSVLVWPPSIATNNLSYALLLIIHHNVALIPFPPATSLDQENEVGKLIRGKYEIDIKYIVDTSYFLDAIASSSCYPCE